MDDFDALIHLVAGAPEPTKEQIGFYMQKDKLRNPHNERSKPKLRDTMEIIADYKLEFARMILDKIGRSGKEM